MTLKAYVGYCPGTRDEEAVLVFARTAREARNLTSLHSCGQFTHLRANLLEDQDFWMRFCPGEPRCMDPPAGVSCEACCQWAKPEGGNCGVCGAKLPSPPS